MALKTKTKTLTIDANAASAIAFLEALQSGFNASKHFRISTQKVAVACGWRPPFNMDGSAYTGGGEIPECPVVGASGSGSDDDDSEI